MTVQHEKDAPLIPDQRASLALWAPPAESVDGTVAFCYNYIAMNMEMYRSGRNENDSKSGWMLRRISPFHTRKRQNLMFWQAF